MTHQWQPGDTASVTGYYTAQYTPSPGAPHSVSTYRVDAVKRGRCYVTHLTGPRHQRGVHGWDNQWFDVSDERVMYVDG